MPQKILFTIACVVLPVVWGVLVNWVFNLWHERANGKRQDDRVYPDYQI